MFVDTIDKIIISSYKQKTHIAKTMFTLPTNVVLLEDNKFPHREILYRDPGPIPGFVVLVHRKAPLYVRSSEILGYEWVDSCNGSRQKVREPVYGDDFIHQYTGKDITVWQAITQAEYDTL